MPEPSRLFAPPPHCGGIRVVGSFAELAAATFGGGVNALCWPRALRGDFAEVVSRLPRERGIASIDDATLAALDLSPAGQVARDFLLKDQERLRGLDLDPVLDCINGYAPSTREEAIPTHVQSWHVDSATAEADTWLCTYVGASTEGLRNEDGQRRVDVAETRAALLECYGGADDGDFLEYLADHCYDLHYQARPGARPWSFGLGNLWRIACEYPGSPVRPCLHRAPATVAGQGPRLLLLS